MKRTDEDPLVGLAEGSTGLAEFYERHFDRVVSFLLRRVRSPDDAAGRQGGAGPANPVQCGGLGNCWVSPSVRLR